MQRIRRQARRLATAALVVTIAAPWVNAADLCGDANGDGGVTVTDGVQTLRTAAGLSNACTLARCDVDGNGTITVTDGVNVLRAAAGLPNVASCGITSPTPTPGPVCSSLVVTIALQAAAPVGAARLVLAYPSSQVVLPGTGDAVASRVTIRTSNLFANGAPNDLDDRVVFSLVSLMGLGSGEVATVRFDCLGGTPPLSAFTCTLSDVFGPDAVTSIGGTTCTLQLAPG